MLAGPLESWFFKTAALTSNRWLWELVRYLGLAKSRNGLLTTVYPTRVAMSVIENNEQINIPASPLVSLILVIIYPWLDFGLPPHCPQVAWCHWGEIEPFSATLAQDWLAECDQPGKNPLKYSVTTGNWTQAMERMDSEIRSFSDWAIMTRATEGTDSEIHSFSHWAIMTRATERTDSEIHSVSQAELAWLGLVMRVYMMG